MMVKGRSLRRQVIRYGTISFVVTCVFILATYVLNQYLNLRQALDFEANRLVVTAQKQADQILPGLLVAEEYGSVDLQLDRIKESEDLLSATSVKAPDGSLSSMIACPKTEKTHICTSYFNNQIVTATEIGLPGEVIAYLVKHKSLSSLRKDDHLMISLGILFGGIAVVFLGLIGSLLLFIDRHVRTPLLSLKDHLGPVLDGEKGMALDTFTVEEVQAVAVQVEELVEKFQEKKVAAAQGELAAQVAHDIRSPLVLLNVLSKEATGLSTENKKLLGLVSERVQKISANLLERYRADGISPKTTTSLVLAVAERIVIEKQAMHRGDSAEIILNVDESAITSFIGVNSTELGRALANLIENGVEACDKGTGKVTVSVKSDKECVEIEIADNGRGITSNLLPRLGLRGSTSGKPNGNGLGLYHARSIAESASGHFQIESEVGKGSVVRLTFPKARTPSWFTSILQIDESMNIVSIDDDSCIHEIWKRLFGERLKSTHTELFEKLREEVADPNIFFLVDNQISSDGPHGIDFIEANEIGHRAILISTDFEDETLQARCVKVGCHLIPKPLIPYLSVKGSLGHAEQKLDLALIDNDELVQVAWQLRAQGQKKKLGIFENANDFIQANVSIETPIYIDHHLNDGVSGIDVAQLLSKKGYQSLFITTGDDRVKDLPQYIKSVYGKEFPPLDA